jgi:fumarate reductase flavoprotein subunit
MAQDFDVIIVGGGGAGLSAAIEATEAGLRCMVLEADGKLGGATALSGGVVYAAGTQVQREGGYTDDAESMFEYVMALNQWALKPDIIRYISDHSAEAIDWLAGIGVSFPPQALTISGVEKVPRGHPAEGAGLAIAEALINRAGVVGVEYALGTRVERLLVEDGRVTGVCADGQELRAPVTVIATGGFGNSDAMRKRFFPSVAQHGSWVWAVHDDAPFILGDGLTMGEAIGAGLTGHDTGLPLPTSGFGKHIEAFLPPWTMIVNEEGRRFMPEIASYTICGYLINEQTNAHAWAIFDEPTLIEASNDGSYLDPYGTGMTTPIWEEPNIRKQVENGRIMTADTLEELAAQTGVDPLSLAETVRQYNADIDDGRGDTQFQKKAKKLFPVRSAPFYAVEVRAAIIGGTGAGLDIDSACHVLDTHGKPIPGLLAAGETTGVTQGKRYAGGGFSLGPAIVLGRRAGQEAVSLIRANGPAPANA